MSGLIIDSIQGKIGVKSRLIIWLGFRRLGHSKIVTPLEISHIGRFYVSHIAWSYQCIFDIALAQFSQLTLLYYLLEACTSWYMSACRNATGMLVTTTYLPSFASKVHDIIIIASRDTVGALVSALVVYYPSHISYLCDLFLSSYDISSFFVGKSTCHSCNWFSSSSSALFPLSPNLFMSSFMLICVSSA